MRTVDQASLVSTTGQPVSVAIGFFDGVHVGHQRVIQECLRRANSEQGLSVVITFDQHPSTIVAPERVPSLIYPLRKKLRIVEELGVAVTLLYHFDQAFSQQPAETFVENLVRDISGLSCISIGSNFTFGHKRRGNLQLLEELGRKFGVAIQAAAPVLVDGLPVSSTRVRDSIRTGVFASTAQMLGRPYALVGKVTRGDRLGQRLGFPTANLETSGLVLPPDGVYAVSAIIAGSPRTGVLNIGVRPTLDEPVRKRQVEVHFLDFQGDLYDVDLEITIRSRLRDERRFATLDELKAQIAKDITATRMLVRSV